MDPFTIGIGLMAAGSLFSAWGASQRGKAERKMAEFQAKLDEQAAADANIRGQHEAGLLRMKASKVLAAQQAEYAAVGVDPSSGTAAEVQGATAAEGELQAQVAINNAAREAWGYRSHAAVARYQGKMAEKAADMDALSSILGGAGNISSLYVRQSTMRTYGA